MPYISNTDSERQEMLRRVGAGSVEDLLKDVPQSVRLKRDLQLPEALAEFQLRAELETLAARNCHPGTMLSFLGAGCYSHHIPGAVTHVVSRSEFSTAYTPYQAEASQGTLQAIYEFQSLICGLTGAEIANASLYDGASALAEGLLMARSITRRGKILLSEAIHPLYRDVARSYCCCCTEGAEGEIGVVPLADGVTSVDELKTALGNDVACIAVQYPNFFGSLEDIESVAQLSHEVGALLLVVTNPLSLGILAPPAARGADIVVGDTQPLGIPSSFGGPTCGYLACRKEYVRRVPGRIVGATTDTEGRRAYVLTLQTREQHIRREKATSNICTNQGLMALATTVHLALMGPSGLKDLGEAIVRNGQYAARRLSEIPGCGLAFGQPFFQEFVLKVPGDSDRLAGHLVEKGVLAGLPLGRHYSDLSDCLLMCVTEKHRKEDIDTLGELLESAIAGADDEGGS